MQSRGFIQCKGSAGGSRNPLQLQTCHSCCTHLCYRPCSYGGWLDAHWHEEVGARLPQGNHYLDFTGSGLYTNSQLAAATAELAAHVYGNPHATNPSSVLSTRELTAAREMVLQHFNADPSEYVVVFTRWDDKQTVRANPEPSLGFRVCGLT